MAARVLLRTEYSVIESATPFLKYESSSTACNWNTRDAPDYSQNLTGQTALSLSPLTPTPSSPSHQPPGKTPLSLSLSLYLNLAPPLPLPHLYCSINNPILTRHTNYVKIFIPTYTHSQREERFQTAHPPAPDLSLSHSKRPSQESRSHHQPSNTFPRVD
ncbi:uncharacterized protein BO66DRAFT_163911 [Aspergillus aculeatinus CBS 121060]|uniref:Uncharacterized protein n=1 Tax=Aspergillus aculeatinus CBS 121060 TaxID=1448322 RepID=A0ACD1H013_9EURO|nr:hypothetical protein BO66DRAFT_163911 [Aspergillus aculeatinus CBS 121060]RAH66913.1 hypothetical protein BO66DRAFT_163911 [Aspergillus aculeatinus CBS 121060]